VPASANENDLLFDRTRTKHKCCTHIVVSAQTVAFVPTKAKINIYNPTVEGNDQLAKGKPVSRKLLSFLFIYLFSLLQ
jgi:hypothetical protein